MLQKKPYNPADRNAGKAFHRPPYYVKNGNPQHITKVISVKRRVTHKIPNKAVLERFGSISV